MSVSATLARCRSIIRKNKPLRANWWNRAQHYVSTMTSYRSLIFQLPISLRSVLVYPKSALLIEFFSNSDDLYVFVVRCEQNVSVVRYDEQTYAIVIRLLGQLQKVIAKASIAGHPLANQHYLKTTEKLLHELSEQLITPLSQLIASYKEIGCRSV